MTNAVRKIKMISAISTLAELSVDHVTFDVSDYQETEYKWIAVYFNVDDSADTVFYIVKEDGEMKEIARCDCYAGIADIHNILSMIFDLLDVKSGIEE